MIGNFPVIHVQKLILHAKIMFSLNGARKDQRNQSRKNKNKNKNLRHKCEENNFQVKSILQQIEGLTLIKQNCNDKMTCGSNIKIKIISFHPKVYRESMIGFWLTLRMRPYQPSKFYLIFASPNSIFALLYYVT